MGKPLEFFCAAESRSANIPLMATAPRVDVWLLVEYPHPWGHKALEESNIPGAVKGYLTEHAAAIANSRIQLIKRRSLRDAETYAFQIVLSREVNPVRYTYQLPSYESLLDLDLQGIAAELPYFAPHATSEPLYLVCTNGRRDACCAARGLPVFETLARLVGEAVWQTTHVGGHRFAANLVCLPHGLCYGRVDDLDVAMLVQEYARGRAFIPAFRGRSCYPPEVQAAASYLRAQNNLLEVSRTRLEEAIREAPDQWLIRFGELGGPEHQVRIRVERGAYEAYSSCGAEKRDRVDAYHLIEYQRG